MRTPLFPNHTAIICVEIVTAVRQDGQNETTATILEENSFGFPYRLASMEVMHYTRSRTVFQPMSTVLTMMEYYEQTVLAGVVMASGGARVFSVDPLTGQECENERCVPPEDGGVIGTLDALSAPLPVLREWLGRRSTQIDRGL